MFRHRRGLRFLEPALLALLRERQTHGYELIAQLPSLLGTDRVDVGNVYRALRALEERGLVTSEWRDDLPGPAKRSYAITDDGRRALRRWAEWLTEARGRIDSLLATIAEGGDHART
jgi:PadR family transcriptional regulator, regulatory protein PadR